MLQGLSLARGHVLATARSGVQVRRHVSAAADAARWPAQSPPSSGRGRPCRQAPIGTARVLRETPAPARGRALHRWFLPSQQGLPSSQHGRSSQQGCAACAIAPKANSRTSVERIVRNISFSVVWRIWFLRRCRHRGGGSAGAGSMPVAEAVITPSQAIVTVNWAIGSAVSAGVPTWQPGHAMTPPKAACPSQQGQGSPSMCAGFAAATTTAGKATHSIAATRASVDRMRAAKVITPARIRGSRGSVRPFAIQERPRLRYRNRHLFRIFRKYRLTFPATHPRLLS